MTGRPAPALAAAAAVVAATAIAATPAFPCSSTPRGCPAAAAVPVEPEFLQARSAVDGPGGIPVVSDEVTDPFPAYSYRLVPPCVVSDAVAGACETGLVCEPVEDRLIRYYLLQRLEYVRPPESIPAADVAAREANDQALAGGLSPGDPRTGFGPYREGCVDVTELNPAPTPAEVYSRFQELPLPELRPTVPSGGVVLAGVPLAFSTDAPAELAFTVDIRGFAVVITAVAQQYSWHTGDGGTTVQSTTPGAPHPFQTLTHDYVPGSYTSSLTVTWGGTYTVDGGAVTAVTGTTTTEGPPVQLTAIPVHAVLVDPRR